MRQVIRRDEIRLHADLADDEVRIATAPLDDGQVGIYMRARALDVALRLSAAQAGILYQQLQVRLVLAERVDGMLAAAAGDGSPHRLSGPGRNGAASCRASEAKRR